MVTIALCSGHYDLKILRSLFRAKKNTTSEPQLALWLPDAHPCIYMYTYVRTFLIRVRMLVICDRNSIATKREEFPARVVEVASSRLHFASLAHLLQLLQQRYPALCQQPAWNSVLVTKCKFFWLGQITCRARPINV